MAWIGTSARRWGRSATCCLPVSLRPTPGVWPAIALPIHSVWPCRIRRIVVIQSQCSGQTKRMKIVVFGLSISSSWGNGHATLWRGLCRALGSRGHRVVFYERDVPYYASNRDGTSFAGCDLRLYNEWSDIATEAKHETRDADVAMVTSYCP